MHLAIVAAEPGEEASGGVEGLAKLRNVILCKVLIAMIMVVRHHLLKYIFLKLFI